MCLTFVNDPILSFKNIDTLVIKGIPKFDFTSNRFLLPWVYVEEIPHYKNNPEKNKDGISH
jgi:hypothetical protein